MGTGVAFSPWPPENLTNQEDGMEIELVRNAAQTLDRPFAGMVSGLDKSGQASRLISTGKLNASPRLHFRPIEVVVFDRP